MKRLNEVMAKVNEDHVNSMLESKEEALTYPWGFRLHLLRADLYLYKIEGLNGLFIRHHARDCSVGCECIIAFNTHEFSLMHVRPFTDDKLDHLMDAIALTQLMRQLQTNESEWRKIIHKYWKSIE